MTVVPDDGNPVGRARGGQPGHAAIVLCGDDAVALGAAAAELVARGRRAAIWLGDPDVDAIIEMVDELFISDPNQSVK